MGISASKTIKRNIRGEFDVHLVEKQPWVFAHIKAADCTIW